MSDQLIRLRFLVQDRLPVWLRGKNAQTLFYVLQRLVDRSLDAAVAAVKHRYPGYYSFDGLSLSGRERMLRRSIFQDDQAYSERLLRYIEANQLRGNPEEMLRELYWFHRPQLALVTCLIERSGHRYTMMTGTADEPGDIVEDQIANWNPHTDPDRWATYRIIMYGLPVYQAAPLPTQRRALQDLASMVSEFNPARCQIDNVVIYADSGDDFWGAVPPPPGHPEITEGTWGGGTWGAEHNPLIIEVG